MGTSEQQAVQPIINIVGEKVALGPMRRDLVPVNLKWINDFEVTRTLAMGLRPHRLESEEAWYDGLGARGNEVAFTINEKATTRPIGTVALMHVDHSNRTAEFGIMIGEKDCWNQGCGTEATRLMLDYGFTGLGLHNIVLTAYGYNERAIRAYTRAGFRLMGRRREARRFGGQAYDVVYMDCLATEFESPVLHRLLPNP